MAVFNNKSLENIKSKPTGDGQHGTARWATKKEINSTYYPLIYEVDKWRHGESLPEIEGTILGYRKALKKVTALVDQGDNHTMMIAAAGAGKTACFIYPNLEFACATGMSFLTTDTKGDIYRNLGTIAEKHYGYDVSVIDLRNPTKSDGFNMLKLVNHYSDLYKKTKSLQHKAKAERYAKIISKTIIDCGSSGADRGSNAYFYEAAEGIVTAAVLLVAEFCEPEKRHIVSVYKIIQDLLAPSTIIKDKSQFQLLMDTLPPEHKARWFAGAALNTGEETMRNVMSTALSRLNGFLDSELEQILCFESCIDAEKFCNTKSALFLVMPEEDATKHFLISLIVQQLYREILSVSDELGGKLKKRVVFYLDEIGTIPRIESIEMMFSAARSRGLLIVGIIQSLAQLEKNYTKEGAEIIIDNTQNTIFGGFAPLSNTAEVLSKGLGEQTVMSGSLSKGKDSDSQSLQMIGRPLMTTDELKALPKFHFVVMKTGAFPMKTEMSLFFNWGITFDGEYQLVEQAERLVRYADRKEIAAAIAKAYPKEKPEEKRNDAPEKQKEKRQDRDKAPEQQQEQPPPVPEPQSVMSPRKQQEPHKPAPDAKPVPAAKNNPRDRAKWLDQAEKLNKKKGGGN